jgi:hypothetical protein
MLRCHEIISFLCKLRWLVSHCLVLRKLRRSIHISQAQRTPSIPSDAELMHAQSHSQITSQSRTTFTIKDAICHTLTHPETADMNLLCPICMPTPLLNIP